MRCENEEEAAEKEAEAADENKKEEHCSDYSETEADSKAAIAPDEAVVQAESDAAAGAGIAAEPAAAAALRRFG